MKNKGFTLVELLIYIAIVGIVVLSISGLYILLMDAKVKNQTVAEVEQQGDQVMEIINQTVRNSTNINSPVPGASGSTLSINVIDPSKSPTVFTISGSTIQMTEGANPAIILTSNRITASNLVFENLTRPSTAGIVRTHFTLSHVNPASKNQFNYSKTYWGSAALRDQ